MKELKLHTKTWMHLTNMMWSERSPTKKTVCCLILFMSFSKTGKATEWWDSDYPSWES